MSLHHITSWHPRESFFLVLVCWFWWNNRGWCYCCGGEWIRSCSGELCQVGARDDEGVGTHHHLRIGGLEDMLRSLNMWKFRLLLFDKSQSLGFTQSKLHLIYDSKSRGHTQYLTSESRPHPLSVSKIQITPNIWQSQSTSDSYSPNHTKYLSVRVQIAPITQYLRSQRQG